MRNSNLPNFHWLIAPNHPLSIWLKLAMLAAVSIVLKPFPTQPTWAVLMTLFAAFVLVPIGFQQVMKRQTSFKTFENALVWHLPTAILLALSFVLEKGNLAGFVSLAYVGWNLAILLRGLKMDFSLPYLMTLAAFGFLLNASIWLAFDRFDYQPLGFSAWIVLLTGTHFHFAGFALTVALALFLNDNPDSKWAKTVSLAVLIEVILTATGITLTQLGFNPILETVAGVWMALVASFAGLGFIKSSFSQRNPTKILWLIGGSCLVFAMFLACLYALRPVLTLPFLSLPFMQAVHGSVNALGFGTLILIGFDRKNGSSCSNSSNGSMVQFKLLNHLSI